MAADVQLRQLADGRRSITDTVATVRRYAVRARRPLLGHGFRVDRQLVIGTRPARARVGEDARLRLDRGIVVQRSGRNHDSVGVLGLTRQAAAARSAESISEPLGLGHLECADLLLTAEPLERPRLQEKVRGMPRTRRLATTRAMAMVEPLRFAGRFVLYGSAQATALEGGLGHAPLRSMIERWRIR